jgi:alpha-D-ribose 1-methylphosphonate 5-triphosphate synthase subunit PhnH
MMSEVTDQDLQAWGPQRQQAVFRQLMRAFSFPGRIETLAGDAALTQTLATLVDSEVTLADPQQLIDALTRQRLQTRMAGAERAQFIVADGSLPPAFEPSLGTLESPEQGATILLQVAKVGEGAAWQLTGPGIAASQSLAIAGLDPAWIERRRCWNEGFPLGVDLILIDRSRVVALPRTTSITSITPATRITAQGEQ